MTLIGVALASIATAFGSAGIKSVRVGNPVGVMNNQGDAWIGAWCADGALYSASNATFGFHRVCNSNIAFKRQTVQNGTIIRFTV